MWFSLMNVLWHLVVRAWSFTHYKQGGRKAGQADRYVLMSYWWKEQANNKQKVTCSAVVWSINIPRLSRRRQVFDLGLTPATHMTSGVSGVYGPIDHQWPLPIVIRRTWDILLWPASNNWTQAIMDVFLMMNTWIPNYSNVFGVMDKQPKLKFNKPKIP